MFLTVAFCLFSGIAAINPIISGSFTRNTGPACQRNDINIHHTVISRIQFVKKLYAHRFEISVKILREIVRVLLGNIVDYSRIKSLFKAVNGYVSLA